MAACSYARDKGYRYAVLNSTEAGRRTYARLGFTTVGDGWTWWLVMDRLLSKPPTPGEILLVEAIGRGDEGKLAEMRTLHKREDLNRTLTNGMTPMQVAVHCRQPLAAEWLLAGGAAYAVLDAWDLGWKERARQLLKDCPGQVNDQYGEGNRTLLHIAVERNDGELARMALSANPDLRLKDKNWGGTALDWATHFGYSDLASLIQSQSRG
jgi:hypothetical protein